jgi:hypothetical protein
MSDEPAEVSYEPQRERGAPNEHWKARSTWVRLFFMIVMAVCFAVTRLVLTVVVVVQFLHVLFTGGPNPRLKDFGASLGAYVHEIIAYLTFNTEVRPFPFDAEWPAPRSTPSPDA